MADKKPGNWLDRTILAVAPQWGLRRLQARWTSHAVSKQYDAAGDGRRAAGWHRSATDANAANRAALTVLRELSRDLRRNNGWARRAINVIANNTVGWGIAVKPIGARERRHMQAMAYWNAWANKTSCDWDGRLPFTGLQRLVMETVVESGECIVLRERATSSDGLALPLRIRVLEPDHIDTLRNGILGPGGGPIIQGVEFDKRGRRVAYWLFPRHPGSDRIVISEGLVSKRIPAEDVIHIYRIERPAQTRGVPWLASAIGKLQDFDDYDDAVLMQQKIAACFGAFVKDLDGASSPLGQADDPEDGMETLEPGHIQYLPPGKDVTFASPPPTTDHGNFTSTTLRRIAASLDITYEDLTGDFSKVNFSSARMARLAHWSSVVDWQWNMMIPQFCNGVWDWAMQAAATLEGWTDIPSADWSPPPMPMLDPQAEAKAYTSLVRGGIMTLAQVLRERGEDPDAHLAEIKKVNDQLDELEIVLDSDPRRTNTAGAAQADAATSEPAAPTNGKSDNYADA